MPPIITGILPGLVACISTEPPIAVKSRAYSVAPPSEYGFGKLLPNACPTVVFVKVIGVSVPILPPPLSVACNKLAVFNAQTFDDHSVINNPPACTQLAKSGLPSVRIKNTTSVLAKTAVDGKTLLL